MVSENHTGERDVALLPRAYPLLLITIGLIVYGSLYPWKFGGQSPDAKSLLLVFDSWPGSWDEFLMVDCASNVFLYLPLGALAFLTFWQQGRRWSAFAGATGLGFVLSACMETLQLFDEGRVTSTLDLFCNVSGTLAGAGVGWLLPVLLHRKLRPPRKASLVRLSSPILLVLGWLAYQGFPFYPEMSRTQLRLKLAELTAASSFPWSETTLFFAEWLAIAVAIESAAGTRYARRIVPLVWLIVPAKLLLDQRTFTWPELAGAVAACVVAWNSPLPRGVGRTRTIAGLLAAALVLNGLSPFVFASAGAFCWVPFGGFLAGGPSGLLVILRKCFWYGAEIWLVRESGLKTAFATGAVAILLAGIEVLQIHLPGRTPEITDPVLALLLGLSLWLADRSTKLY